jgi:hypothetical protein
MSTRLTPSAAIICRARPSSKKGAGVLAAVVRLSAKNFSRRIGTMPSGIGSTLLTFIGNDLFRFRNRRS